MTNSAKAILLYRATRDGFTGLSFHSKCDGKANTVTIIKTDGDYVFGGFTSVEWKSVIGYIADTNAFIFSLRRNGISNFYKFLIVDASDAIFGNPLYGPAFGLGHDIVVRNRSDINVGSNTAFCGTYQFPSGYTYGNSTFSFLAGSYDKWLSTEIEVYQLIDF
jgi:hypothetical protein